MSISSDLLPILDLNLAFADSTKPIFLADLKKFLLDIGFFYVKNIPVDNALFGDVVNESNEFFNLPLEEKLKVEMTKSKHFLGYTKLGNEITAGNVDWREQIDLATELSEPVVQNDDELWKNIEGPNLWPDSSLVPKFRPVFENYMNSMSDFSIWFINLIEESLELPKGSFDKFFQKPRQQVKLKIIKYPDFNKLDPNLKNDIIKEKLSDKTAKVQTNQGVGEHRDSDFITYIFQPTDHTSLEVESYTGEWIKVPPLQDTLVVAVGQTLEAITQGVCKSTIHRVLTPGPGEGDRLSIPLFQTIDISSYKTALKVPEKLLKERDERDRIWAKYRRGEIGFQFSPNEQVDKPIGWFVLLNRIKSHQDVSRIWYPKLLDQVLEEIKRNNPK
ncbi:hypothetical protein PACTADRAFT_50816 [Pachysolen tannophilus NRRL Y-2460]|uniref:Fe2OG dioxygenase domain-containing protein n=1 Tax=Pachysolen tannophilus NRRL Y-2460 TaxID=669874 RepID=A0A1E4TTA2_PACTA|nr:hypothetical protein PACTADRAFT_50816 [Pachysolen tannophilus NRRL Y-2460]